MTDRKVEPWDDPAEVERHWHMARHDELVCMRAGRTWLASVYRRDVRRLAERIHKLTEQTDAH